MSALEEADFVSGPRNISAAGCFKHDNDVSSYVEGVTFIY
jgi:hypothetical protein